MSSAVVKAGKWLAKAAMGGAGAWSWAIWLGAGALAAGGAMVWHADQVADAAKLARAAGAKEVQGQWTEAKLATAYADNAALRESQREVSRLVQVNQEVQRDLDIAEAAASDLALARARSAGLRERERADIVAAAERAAAGTCGRYAAAAERDIAGVEDDATALGLRAAKAQAAAHAFRRTLDERRAAIEARREALKPTTPKE